MHILFYSNNCPFSKQIIELIVANQLSSHFKLISVEDPNIKIPPIITNVPTLIIKNVNRPLIGLDAFNWINMQKFINICTYNSTAKIDNPVLKCENDEKAKVKEGKYTFFEDDKDIDQNIKNEELLIGDKIIKDEKITEDVQNKIIDNTIKKRTIDMEILFHAAKKSSSRV